MIQIVLLFVKLIHCHTHFFCLIRITASFSVSKSENGFYYMVQLKISQVLYTGSELAVITTLKYHLKYDKIIKQYW